MGIGSRSCRRTTENPAQRSRRAQPSGTAPVGTTLAEAEAILTEWPPDMTVVDMDHDDSTALLQRLGASATLAKSVTYGATSNGIASKVGEGTEVRIGIARSG